MAKLRDLVRATAFVLGEPEASVNVRAMALRKAGLIHSTGRGLHSADMEPSDATNLLLACLVDGPATGAATTVSHARQAQRQQDEWVLKRLPPPEFGLAPVPDTAGEALDALFQKVLGPAATLKALAQPRIVLFVTSGFRHWHVDFWFGVAEARSELHYRQDPINLRGRRPVDLSAFVSPDDPTPIEPAYLARYRDITEHVPVLPLWLIAQTLADRFRAPADPEVFAEPPRARRP